MVHYLAEDPWPLTLVFGLAATGFLIALWVTQQGKYLIWAGSVAAVAAFFVAIEYVWVTDNERIEAVVYTMAQAAERSDAETIIANLTPDAAIEWPDTMAGRLLERHSSHELTERLRDQLQNTRFDYLRITKLETNAGGLSRQGTANFRVYAMGSVQTSLNQLNFATGSQGMDWSLGFRETSPRVWKVYRITPINPPPYFRGPLGMPSR